MNKVYLSIGGNRGDRLDNINKSLVLLEERVGKIFKTSSVYETAAWGNTNQQDFLNLVVWIETELSSDDLLDSLISIEKTMGRVRSEEKWQPRTVDIDILFFNNEVVDTEKLTIPHPYIKERKFVLIPLSEIAPLLIHPLYNEKINELLLRCEDVLPVKLYSE